MSTGEAYQAVLTKQWWDASDVMTYLALPSKDSARKWLSRHRCRRACGKTRRAWVDATMVRLAGIKPKTKGRLKS
jgi:hypothetical protein